MAGEPRILIVDDEPIVVDSLRNWFVEDGYPVGTARSGKEALTRFREQAWDIALIDIRMPGMDGLELQRKLKEINPEIIIIIMTAYASVETAVRALKEGAYDYIVKPFDPDDLEHLIKNALEHHQLKLENLRLRQNIEETATFEEIVGDSPQIRQVTELIKTVAPMDTTVLLIGESGTGKELVARAIHRHSPRRYMPLVSVNCGALTESLLESELFGHEKGAFTGASYRRKGKFEVADGGTIFFDEIGNISLKTQVELLRVLEEKTITRVGGNEPIRVDFRVIAATNRDLKEAVAEGTFREDLYYRVNVFSIYLPPLRERRMDIPILTEHFLQKFATTMRKGIRTISSEAMEILVSYDWPGNVRELENAIERAVVIGKGSELIADDLPFGRRVTINNTRSQSLTEVERLHITNVLNETRWNISRAAKLLEIDRVTLYNKIEKYGLKREQ